MTEGRFDSGKIVQGTKQRSASQEWMAWCFVPVTAAPGPAFRWGSPLVEQGGSGEGRVPVGRGKMSRKPGETTDRGTLCME
jgi:hypothetical protein